MPPKRKAAPKSKKAEQIAIEDDMSRITVRRLIKNDESENLKNDEQEVCSLQEDISGNNSNMNAMVVIDKMSDVNEEKQNFEENDKHIDTNIKSVLKKNAVTKVTKPESKKKTIDDGKVSKKIRKRAASEDKQTNKDEEKVVNSRSKKRLVDKDVTEPSSSQLNEPQKRNRRAASVDVLTKNPSSVVLEPKRIRKTNKGSTVQPTEDLTKRHRRSSSLDSLDMKTSSITEVPGVTKKIRKATKAVVEPIDDKQKKNSKVIKKKEPKTLKKNKNEEKNTNKEIIDEKENADLLLLEQNNDSEEILDEIQSTIPLTKEQINEELEIEDILEKIPKQINSRSRGKKQVVQRVISKSKQNKSSEESSGKTDTDDSDVLKTPEQPTEEQGLESVEDSSEKIPKQTYSRIRGKRQVTQKQILKTNKLSEESSEKSNTDDSDMAKNSPEIKPKRIGKQKKTNVDNEVKLPRRPARKVNKTVDFEEDEILSSDENVKTGNIPDDIPDTPESDKNPVPTIVKRKAKAKPTKK